MFASSESAPASAPPSAPSSQPVPLKLIKLQIRTDAKIWERCLVQSYVPPREDVEYYYKTLLNFQDVVLTMTVEDIPHDFNAALLPNHESAPSEFPANDLETKPDEKERREKYNNFINQLCEMERSRAALKEFQKGGRAKTKYTNAITEEPLYLSGFLSETHTYFRDRRAWVNDVLKELDTETDYSNENALTITDAEKPPCGWIVCPVVASARSNIGSRIITDPSIGLKWERLLGTDIYPDLIFLRRISTKGWNFEGSQSEKLLESIVSWFITSQDLTIKDGMTDFSVGLEKELGKIITLFRKVKVGDRLLDNGDESNPRVRIHKLMSQIESQCLDSADTNTDIQPISSSVFNRYLTYVFKAAGVPREAYTTDEKIASVIERWTTARYGFVPEADPTLPEWKEVWNYIMRGKPTAIRVNHFLASMDSWDPLLCSHISSIDRSAIAQEWMKIYLDTQIIKNESGKVKSVILHDQLRKWCMRFIPETIFNAQFSASIIGPVLTKRGLISVKVKNGRYIQGIKFKNLVGNTEDLGGEVAATDAEIKASETVKEANSVQYTTVTSNTDDGKEVKHRTVEAMLLAERDGARIEHFFTASVTTETIHLGDL